jgi:hypothetical protein
METDMTSRSTRYEIWNIETDGSRNLLQANARKLDAIKRAKFILADFTGWSRTIAVRVIDTRTSFDLYCSYR